MPSPFDDPELRAQMAKMGVVHKPGMAEDLLKEVAPLLKSDGVDLDDLGDTDIETLNAALARATERRNLELLTPIGAQRDAALTALHTFTTAIAKGDEAEAHTIVENIEPEATAPAPSVSHVIGVSLGLLDEWSTDSELGTAMRGARVPGWDRKASRTAASDILTLARKVRAFDSADSLIRRHRGLSVHEGAMLVVAGSLLAVAAARGISLDEVANRMLRGSAPRETPPQHPTSPAWPAASAFRKTSPSASATPKRGRGVSGNPARRSADIADQRLRRDFARWLEQSGFEDHTGVPPRDHAFNLFVIIDAMRVTDLDLNDPADFDDIIEILIEIADENAGDGAEEILVQQLDLLHSYVHFRIDTGDPDAWDDAHVSIEAAITYIGDDAPSPLAEILAEAAQIPVEERKAAYLQLPIVASVRDLLAWVGKSRAVTPAGAVRRADIADLAGFLGIDAVGVARLPNRLDEDGPQQVQSMADIAEVRSWWDALQVCELIEVSPTRVYPGPAAESWMADPEPPFEDVEQVIAMFVAELVNPDEGGKRFEHIAADALLRGLIIALAPDAADEFTDDDAYGLLAAVGHGRMRQLVSLGIVEEPSDADFVVPRHLRGAVAGGVLTALTVMSAMDDLDDVDWE